MTFWGVKVRAGKTVKVRAEEGVVVRVSKATIDPREKKNGEGPLMLKVRTDEKKFLFGGLSQLKFTISLDLSFSKEFELSHDGQATVHLVGYKTPDYDEVGSLGNAPAVYNIMSNYWDDDTEEEEEEKTPPKQGRRGRGDPPKQSRNQKRKRSA